MTTFRVGDRIEYPYDDGVIGTVTAVWFEKDVGWRVEVDHTETYFVEELVVDDRRKHLQHLARRVRELHRRYAELTRLRKQTPETYRERLSLGEKIHELLENVTPEERNEYELW